MLQQPSAEFYNFKIQP